MFVFNNFICSFGKLSVTLQTVAKCVKLLHTSAPEVLKIIKRIHFSAYIAK